MKKIYALILAVIMLVSLFGCKGNSDPTVGTTDPTVTTEPTLGDHEHNHGGETTNTTEGTEATEGTTDATEATTEPTEETTEPSTEATEPSNEQTVPGDPGDIGNGGAPDTPGQNEHKHSYTTKVIAPTCESKGYTEYTCACGDSYKSNETKATGHNYTSKTVEATCGSDGYTKHTCSKCGTSYTDNKTSATGKHSYTTKTIAPTATEDGYDLHTCGVCGKSYKDNYKPKTGNSGSNDSGDHNGMFYNEAEDKWYEWDCATKGHFVREWKVVQEQTCCQYEIKEAKCVVVGCNGVKRQEGNEYGDHIMGSDALIDYDMRYRVRRYDGYTFYFEDEASARNKASEIANEYKNGTCKAWLEYIAYEQVPVFADEYTCMFCGKTCTTSKGDYDYNGELRDRFVWMETYTKDNQP